MTAGEEISPTEEPPGPLGKRVVKILRMVFNNVVDIYTLYYTGNFDRLPCGSTLQMCGIQKSPSCFLSIIYHNSNFIAGNC